MRPISAAETRTCESAQSEDEAPHRRKALEGQFEADQKQQEDDPPLGEFREALRVRDRQPRERRDVAGQGAEAARAQKCAGEQKREYGADAVPVE